MLSAVSGKFTVLHYESGKTLGTVAGQNPKLKVQLSQHLLRKVSKTP
jgi:hypothetical protein